MPSKEGIKTTALRIDYALYGKLVKQAQEEGRSVNGQILYYLRKALCEKDAG